MSERPNVKFFSLYQPVLLRELIFYRSNYPKSPQSAPDDHTDITAKESRDISSGSLEAIHISASTVTSNQSNIMFKKQKVAAVEQQ
ncbi:hypothetical protein AYI70_g2215 [Smittium culicis]|uniref:Uncharacterized protein n=1 Tax=Smittium culicis TaxID=133412 RepID=A0A1R1Y9L2_9FUNG|nr:hypothetical protein AYI70_g2215 [Smittium culicis]